jgi:2-dehydro-3-deoxyphosphogluconate aldolase/(4S)-4-hydroxy-2-oxoglutarate aldolase
VKLADRLEHVRVLPVVTVDSAGSAVALANALIRGGARGIEITLRTPAALDAIAAIRTAHPSLIVGAGTVMRPGDLDAAAHIGADFVVSPGLTRALVDHARARGIDLLPGIATASEAMHGMEQGLDCFKLFPARALNGLALLDAFAGPLAGIRFCPTGGIDEATLREYLAASNVCCVAGSWMAPPALIEAGAWDEVEARMARAMRSADPSTP